jgi:hypothetical protein
VQVDGTILRTAGLYGPGSAIEFTATFGRAPFQHIGFGTDFDQEPWAFISTGSTSDTLFARTKSGSGTIDTPLGPPSTYLDEPHVFRIEWDPGAVRFFVDGTLLQTHTVGITSSMNAAISDFGVGAPALGVDQLTVSTGTSSGVFTSRVLDAGQSAAWSTLYPETALPPGTTVSFETRTGPTSSPDGAWSPWAPVGGAGAVASPQGRYVQYRATLSTLDPLVSPRIDAVAIGFNVLGSLTASVLTVPSNDPHEFVVLVDGVPVSGALGNGDSIGSVTVPSGPHTVSVGAAGGTNLASYNIVLYGSCAGDGTVVVPAGGTASCNVLALHKSNPLPTVSVSDVQLVRPSSGSAQAVFTVTRNEGSFFPVRVNYATQDGSARAGNDYTAVSGTLVFDPFGPAALTVSVPVLPTTRHSTSDSFNLVLSAPSGGTLSDNVGTARLSNRRGQVSIYASDVDHVRSTTTGTSAVFTLSLSEAPGVGEQVSVVVNTSNGTAVAGTDYTKLAATTITFNAGETTKPVSIPVAAQPSATLSRTFNLVLKTPSANAVLADTKAVARLRSPGTTAPAPTAYVTDAVLVRPATGSANAVFTVALSGPAATNVSVKYATVDGTATLAAGDYTKTTGTLTFTPGQVTKTVSVPVFPSARHAVQHAFDLKLSGASGLTVADNLGTARLVSLSGLASIHVADAVVVRSASVATAATLTLRLSSAPAAGESVTVNVATVNGSAIAGSDFTAVPTTAVTFGPGQLTATVTVPVAIQPNGTPVRTFTLALSGASANAVVGDASGLVTLIGP